MTSIFKKSLVAGAMLAVCGTAAAGTMNVATSQSHSKQGLAGVTTAITSSNVTYTVNAAYAVGDLLTLTVTSGGLHSSHTWPSALTFTAGAGGAGAAAGLLSTTANSATYRITSVTATGTQTTIGGSFNLTTFAMSPTAIAAGSVTVTASAVASNGVTAIDAAGTRTGTLAKSVDQFGDMTIGTAFDQTIEVSTGRKTFATGTNDTVAWAASNNTTLLNAAAVKTTSVVVNGDFSAMKNAQFSSANGGTAAYDDTKKQLTLSYTGVVTNDTITVTPPTGASAVVLKAQSFNADGTHTYGTSSSEVIGTNVAAGSWKLNGAVINIPYLPYGANISRILYVTNEGTQDGSVSVDWFDDAGNSGTCADVATAAKKKVTKITAAVDNCVAGTIGTTAKVSATVTVNAPASDITVSASYKVADDRAIVLTDDYKGK